VIVSVNPYSLVELAVLFMAVPLAIQFHAIHWYLARRSPERRSADLHFANVFLCVSGWAVASFMLDNATGPLPALFWDRILFAFVAVSLPLLFHFVTAFIGTAIATWQLAVLDGWALVLAAGTLLPHFASPIPRARGDLSWHNACPWLPEPGPLMIGFACSWLAVVAIVALMLWRHLTSLAPTARERRRRTRLILWGTVICGITSTLDLILTTALDVVLPNPTLIGVMVLCGAAAVALGEEVLQKERLKEAVARYVGPIVAADVIEKGVHVGGGDGESYEATVLFSDIRGFTPLTADMAAPDVVRLLSRYFDAMGKTIFEQGGMLNHMMGDGLLAVFGAPRVLPNHALAAVRSAWGMLAALEELNADRARNGLSSLQIGIGLHSGQVMVGNVGGKDKIEYTVIGDVVNVASRVEQHTKSVHRRILVTLETYERVQQWVRADPVSNAPVVPGDRGRSVPVLAVTQVDMGQPGVDDWR